MKLVRQLILLGTAGFTAVLGVALFSGGTIEGMRIFLEILGGLFILQTTYSAVKEHWGN